MFKTVPKDKIHEINDIRLKKIHHLSAFQLSAILDIPHFKLFFENHQIMVFYVCQSVSLFAFFIDLSKSCRVLDRNFTVELQEQCDFVLGLKACEHLPSCKALHLFPRLRSISHPWS